MITKKRPQHILPQWTPYRALLQAMDNEPGTLLQCSHLVDLNKDGTEELIVLSNDNSFELYTFRDGQSALLR